MGGLPSSRLLKGRGSVIPGDDTITDVDSVDGSYSWVGDLHGCNIYIAGANEETEKWIFLTPSDWFDNSLEVPCS